MANARGGGTEREIDDMLLAAVEPTVVAHFVASALGLNNGQGRDKRPTSKKWLLCFFLWLLNHPDLLPIHIIKYASCFHLSLIHFLTASQITPVFHAIFCFFHL
jgi:hypothetical protein